jgi:hypothetical protein
MVAEASSTGAHPVVFKSAMSYDFAVLTPAAAGSDDARAVSAAISVFEGSTSPGRRPNSRLMDFLADLEAIRAADGDSGWLSVWPLDARADGIGLPTTYPNVDDNIVVLLRIAARHGLVLVDLNAGQVHRPAPGEPVGVKAGDGTRLGALTHARLESLIHDLPSSDPWIVLERAPEVYVQTLRQDDGTYVLEHRAGAADRLFGTTVPDTPEVITRLWAWLRREPRWDADLEWEPVQL